MPDRPLILFSAPEKANRESKPPAFTRTFKPSFGRQLNRLQPTFSVLQNAFEQKNLKIQQSPIGMNPDFALIFETIGTAESFFIAVRNSEGLEWLFDAEYEDFEPDDDFYDIDIKTGLRTEKMLNGKLYCVMSNQQAMIQLLSLWNRYQNGEQDVFHRGFAGLRDIFVNIKSIHKWSAQDRIAETYAIEYWRESLAFDGNRAIPFEIELFFRSDFEKRKIATQLIANEVNEMGGNFLQECIIEEIAYHAILVELPRNSIENLVNHYENVSLSQVDDIMFFRPTCQSAFISSIDAEEFAVSEFVDYHLESHEPIVAVLDGMPIQNHPLLQSRIIIDDPDDYSVGYESKYRIHGTAMASLVIYGDLSRGHSPISRPIYLRPILKPHQNGPDSITESVPTDRLFVDVLHRAVKRIAEGESGQPPEAPNVKIINLSIGDPIRQLTTSMSPVAKLIDFLSYKYKVLFIVSAGNHSDGIYSPAKHFSEIKAQSISERNRTFFSAIKDNQRHMRVLSPAESLNSLTVGAIYDDFSTAIENDRFILAVESGLPAPYSSFGKGYRSIITPDLFFYGGRKLIRGKLNDEIDWAITSREPGCKVAAPFGAASEAGQAFSFGTSDAAAQITHEASDCHDILSQIFISETGYPVPEHLWAVILKAMLTHGASWQNIADRLALATGDSPKQLSKWLGNGVPNIGRVQECTKERITLIGLGALKKDEGEVFKLPLPINFSSRLMKRKLTVTLAYLSPIEANKQMYRSKQMWFTIGDEKGLVPDRENTEWQAVRKGTLQHEIFAGEGTVVWNDDDFIEIKVNCKDEAGNRKEAIPYCLFVSFEIAEGYGIDLYTEVSTLIRQRVPVTNN